MLAECQVQLVRSSGSLLMGPGTPYTILPEWDPWSRTTRSPHTQERPHAHGSLVGTEWVDEAVALIPVSVYRDGASKADWLAAHQELARAFTAVGAPGEQCELRFEWGGNEYVMFGRPRMPRVTTENVAVGKSVEQCVFVAADPRIYSATESSLSTPLPIQQGGLTVPARVATTRLFLPGVAGSYASTPDHADLAVPGDLDVRARLAPRAWTGGGVQTIAAQYDTTNDDRAWQWVVEDDGTLRINASTDGLSGVSVPSTQAVAPGVEVYARFLLDVDNGAGGNDTVFYTGPSLEGPWTQLGSTVTNPGTLVLHDSAVPLLVGAADDGDSNPFRGVVRALQVRSGDGGAIVADPDFTAQAVGASSFTDSTGKTWTVHGDAAIVGDTYTGGLTVPMTVRGVLVGGTVDLVNTGTAASKLRLRIDGPVPEPWIVLQTPQGVQCVDFDLTLSDGQWLDITTTNRQALLNGLTASNQRGRATWDMDYFPLHPGTTTLRFGSSGSATDYPGAKVTAWWRSGWW